MHVAFINSKGFGGNNASGYIISPQKVEELLARKYDDDMLAAYNEKRIVAMQSAKAYEEQAERAILDVTYKFGEDQINESDINISLDGITIPGYASKIRFDL